MTFRDTVGLSFRNLRQAKLRTALTTLGVSIGIASLAGMVSLGVGLQDQVVGRFMQSGLFDAITVTSPALLGPAGEIIRLAGAEGERRKGDVVAALREVLGPYARSDGAIWGPSSTWFVTARNPPAR